MLGDLDSPESAVDALSLTASEAAIDGVLVCSLGLGDKVAEDFWVALEPVLCLVSHEFAEEGDFCGRAPWLNSDTGGEEGHVWVCCGGVNETVRRCECSGKLGTA